MKVSVKELKKTATVLIRGDEPWLEPIHSSFALEANDTCAPGVDGKPRQLRGELSFNLDSFGCVAVRGHIKYEPLVPCSRCDLSIPMDVSQDVDVIFKPRPDEGSRSGGDHSHQNYRGHQPREVTLTSENLDDNYLVADKIDVEELLNDLVQTSIPLQTCQPDPATGHCRYCKSDLATLRVFSSGGDDVADEPVSPFAKLAELKNKK